MKIPWTGGCRCGVNNKTNKPSCANIEGQRKSSCPCLGSTTGCNAACGCKNCNNPCGSRTESAEPISEKVTRAPRKKSYKQQRTSSYLVEAGVEEPKGRWSDLETLTLIVLSNLLKKTCLPVDVSHLHSFYQLFRNYLCNKELLKKLPINVKEVRHITGKLRHINVQYF